MDIKWFDWSKYNYLLYTLRFYMAFIPKVFYLMLSVYGMLFIIEQLKASNPALKFFKAIFDLYWNSKSINNWWLK